MTTMTRTRVSLRHGIGDAVTLDLGPEEATRLSQCSVEDGIEYLLSLPTVDPRFAGALRATMQSGQAVLEIQQGTLTRVVVRRNPLGEVIQTAAPAPLEIGVSKAARGGTHR